MIILERFLVPVGKESNTLCALDLFIHAGNVDICKGRSMYRYEGYGLGVSMLEHKVNKLGWSTRAHKVHKGC